MDQAADHLDQAADHPHIKHVTTEMTLRDASLAAPTIRTAYEEAMGKTGSRLALAIAPVDQPILSAGSDGCAWKC